MSGLHFFVGLRTPAGKYINCEKFNNQLSASAATLKQKQTFSVEVEGGKFYFKSWLGNYLAAEELGTVSAASDSKGNDEGFDIEFLDQGGVHIKTAYGKYLSGTADGVNGSALNAGDSEKFELVFAIHPQVVFKSAEGRFMFTHEDGHVISPNNHQFGRETMVLLEYQNNGTYALRSNVGKYFSVDGSGDVIANASSVGPSESFVFLWVEDKVAIKSVSNGKFVAPEGPKGGLKAKRTTIANREIWEMFDSDAQVALKAHNGKYISCQELNIMCNRTSVDTDEIFTVEGVGEQVAIKNAQGKYFSNAGGNLSASSDTRGASELFTIEYPEFGKVAFTTGGKYLNAKPLGGVVLVSSCGEQEQFEMELLNREEAVFKGSFAGFAATLNGKFTSGSASPEAFNLEYENGLHAVKNSKGEYWSVSGNDIVPGGKEGFEIHYLPSSKIAFKTKGGKYVASESRGALILKDSFGDDTQFEF